MAHDKTLDALYPTQPLKNHNSPPLHGVYHVPGTIVNVLHIYSLSVLLATLCGRRCHYPHFIGEETEGFRGEVPCLRSQRWLVEGPDWTQSICLTTLSLSAIICPVTWENQSSKKWLIQRHTGGAWTENGIHVCLFPSSFFFLPVDQWFSKLGRQTSSISIHWGLVRNAFQDIQEPRWQRR